MYQLAEDLGVWDAEGLSRAMGSRQLAFWQAHYASKRTARHQRFQAAGVVAAAVANFRPFRAPDAPLLTPDAFVPGPPKDRNPKAPARRRSLEEVARLGGAAVIDLTRPPPPPRQA